LPDGGRFVRIGRFGGLIARTRLTRSHKGIGEEMGKPKRKLTAAERSAKRRRQKEFMTVFMNGKMKQVRRPPTIDGMDIDEFIRRNADPIWLHQNEMWEYIDTED
jgi:hypothetical protein